MSIGEYALTDLASAKGYLGTIPKKNGIWIYCSAPSATTATCEVTETTIHLIITGTGASDSTITFSSSSNDTIAELIVSINAVTNWKAGAICNGAATSTDLVVTGALACNTSANEITLKIEDNYNVEKLIDRATDLIERYCNRKLASREYNREFYVGNGANRLILLQYPITRIFRLSAGETNAFTVTCTGATTFASVEVTATKVRLNKDGTVTDITIATYATLTLLVAAINNPAVAGTGWTATLLSSDYGTKAAYYTGVDGSTKIPEVLIMPSAYCKSPTLAYVRIPDDDITDYRLDTVGADEDRDPGMLYMSGGFIGGEYYWVDYIAGYTTIPASLEEACLLLVKYKWDMLKKDSALKSESLGDYSYTLADLKNALPPDILNELAGFRKYSL